MKTNKRWMALLLAALLLCGSLTACGAKNGAGTSSATAQYEAAYDEPAEESGWDGDSGFYDGDYETEELEAPGEAAEEIDGVPQKLVYTAYAELETKDMQPALAAVYKRIEEAGGVIQSENLYNLDAETVDGDAYSYSRGLPSAHLTVRVPSESYRAFIAGLKADPDLIYARSVTSDTQNLTRAYYDMESRVKALRSEEDWLLEFMQQAENVTEMLEVKDRLTEVQREIESLTNSMKIIDYDADWSTVEIDLTQVQRYSSKEGEKSFGDRVAGYFKSSGRTFLDVMEGLLEILIMVLPFLLVIAVAALVIWRIAKAAGKRQQKKRAAMFPPVPQTSEPPKAPDDKKE